MNIVYFIISFIWFNFLKDRLFLVHKDTSEQLTAYNNIIVLILIAMVSVSWIISFPLYIFPLLVVGERR